MKTRWFRNAYKKFMMTNVMKVERKDFLSIPISTWSEGCGRTIVMMFSYSSGVQTLLTAILWGSVCSRPLSAALNNEGTILPILPTVPFKRGLLEFVFYGAPKTGTNGQPHRLVSAVTRARLPFIPRYGSLAYRYFLRWLLQDSRARKDM
jgi:hypothetical protein